MIVLFLKYNNLLRILFFCDFRRNKLRNVSVVFGLYFFALHTLRYHIMSCQNLLCTFLLVPSGWVASKSTDSHVYVHYKFKYSTFLTSKPSLTNLQFYVEQWNKKYEEYTIDTEPYVCVLTSEPAKLSLLGFR